MKKERKEEGGNMNTLFKEYHIILISDEQHSYNYQMDYDFIDSNKMFK